MSPVYKDEGGLGEFRRCEGELTLEPCPQYFAVGTKLTGRTWRTLFSQPVSSQIQHGMHVSGCQKDPSLSSSRSVTPRMCQPVVSGKAAVPNSFVAATPKTSFPRMNPKSTRGDAAFAGHGIFYQSMQVIGVYDFEAGGPSGPLTSAAQQGKFKRNAWAGT